MGDALAQELDEVGQKGLKFYGFNGLFLLFTVKKTAKPNSILQGVF